MDQQRNGVNNTHGGKRKGAGRDPLPVPRKTVNFRILKPIKDKFSKLPLEKKREIRDAVESLINEKSEE